MTEILGHTLQNITVHLNCTEEGGMWNPFEAAEQLGLFSDNCINALNVQRMTVYSLYFGPL